MKTLLFFVMVGLARGLDLDQCLQRDSISCVQVELFREARSFFEQERIELLGGLALVKDKAPGRGPESSRALEQGVMQAEDVERREDALEEYAVDRFFGLFKERKLNWNLAPVVDHAAQAARALAQLLPQQLKDNVASFISEEGRGKKKKLLKALLPILIGLKLKLSAFMVLAYFVIALIAKKALLASLLSLAIAGFIAIRKLLSQQHQPHHEVHDVGHHGWAGPAFGGSYSGGGGGGGGAWESYGDAHGAYSNNVAHTLAYSAQKPAKR